MNERIKELVRQAGIHFHKGGTLDAGTNGIAKFVLYSDMEKFAELIVKECALQCIHNEDMDRIEKHFGVED